MISLLEAAKDTGIYSIPEAARYAVSLLRSEIILREFVSALLKRTDENFHFRTFRQIQWKYGVERAVAVAGAQSA